MTKRTIFLLVAILALAALLRLGWAVHMFHAPLSNDQVEYDSIAWNLVSGHGYQLGDSNSGRTLTAIRGPSYVFFLAGVYFVFGHRTEIPRILQALLDVLTCFLVFQTCKLLFQRVSIALLGASLYALYPEFIKLTGLILTETLINFLLMLAIYWFLYAQLDHKRWAMYASALAVAVGLLAKPVLGILPLLFFVSCCRSVGIRRALVVLLAQIAIMAAVMAPWVIRNTLALHAFVPTVTQGGVTFWGGTGPANGRCVPSLRAPYTPKYAIRAVRGLSEVDRDRWLYRDGLRVIKSNPRRYLNVVLWKIPTLWFSVGQGDLVKVPPKLMLFNLASMILAVLGVAWLKPPRVASTLLLLLVLYFTAIHMVFYSQFRYSLPVYAYLFCFVAAGLEQGARFTYTRLLSTRKHSEA